MSDINQMQHQKASVNVAEWNMRAAVSQSVAWDAECMNPATVVYVCITAVRCFDDSVNASTRSLRVGVLPWRAVLRIFFYNMWTIIGRKIIFIAVLGPWIHSLAVLPGSVDGIRQRGRPPKKWTDNITDWTELPLSQDRALWSKTVSNQRTKRRMRLCFLRCVE